VKGTEVSLRMIAQAQADAGSVAFELYAFEEARAARLRDRRKKAVANKVLRAVARKPRARTS
jgi:hypothetical protein